MKKKDYIYPVTTLEAVDLEQMIAFSGGGKSVGDPMINPDADYSDDSNRSRRNTFWEFSEEEEW